jgi:hypothetical protein
MNRSLCVIVVLLLACAALAVPAPEPFVSNWEYPVDPDRDCRITRNNGVLTIEMPGSYHDYDPLRRRFNAPRILLKLEGNFDLQVRVRIDCSPSTRSTDKGQPSFVSAGFLLIYPETHRCICSHREYGVMQQGIGLEAYDIAPMLGGPRRERASQKGIGEDGFLVRKDWYCKKQNPNMIWDCQGLKQYHAIYDRGFRDWPLRPKADCAYLRLEQHGREAYSYFISRDGERWTGMGAFSGPPAKLKLGLAAFSTSSEPSRVCFDHLKLTRGKKKEPSKEPLLGPSIYKASLSMPSFP